MRTSMTLTIAIAASVLAGPAVAYPLFSDVLPWDMKFGTASYRAYMATKPANYAPGKGDYYYWLELQNRIGKKEGGVQTPVRFPKYSSDNSSGIGKVDISFVPALHGTATKDDALSNVPIVTANCGADENGNGIDDCFMEGMTAPQFKIRLFKNTADVTSEAYTITYGYTNTVTNELGKIAAIIGDFFSFPVIKDTEAASIVTPGLKLVQDINAAALNHLSTTRGPTNKPGEGIVYLTSRGTANENGPNGATALHVFKAKVNNFGEALKDAEGHLLVDTPLKDELIVVRAQRIPLDGQPGKPSHRSGGYHHHRRVGGRRQHLCRARQGSRSRRWLALSRHHRCLCKG